MASSADHIPKPEPDEESLASSNNIRIKENVNENMSSELSRISTYKGIPRKQYKGVWPTQLGHAGLYYDDKTCETVCYSCGFRKALFYWTRETCPTKTHMAESPKCDFVTGKCKKNVPFRLQSQSNIIIGTKPITSKEHEKKQKEEKESIINVSHTKHKRSCIAENYKELSEKEEELKDLSDDTIHKMDHFIHKVEPRNSPVATPAISILDVSSSAISISQTTKDPIPFSSFTLSYQQPAGNKRGDTCPPTKDNFSLMNTSLQKQGELVPQSRSGDSNEVKKMRYEERRLMSFTTWPVKHLVSPEECAKTGFYYTGSMNVVECAFCKIRLDTWKFGTDPAFEHFCCSPRCKFLLGLQTDNVPIPHSRKEIARTNFNTSASPIPIATESKYSLSLTSEQQKRRNENFIQSYDLNLLLRFMKSEENRLMSFITWPTRNIISPEECACTGFFYIGPLDRLACAFCENVLYNWKKGDNPKFKHMKHFPTCRFVLGLQSDNVPILPVHRRRAMKKFQTQIKSLPQCTGNAGPFYAPYANGNLRLLTFEKWPHKYEAPTKEEISKAGFFYTGQEDKVRCFFCNLGLRDWEKNDDPITEHRSNNRTCSFIMQIYQQQQEQQQQQQQQSQIPRLLPNVSNSLFDPQNARQKLISMGFDNDAISRTQLQQYCDNKKDFSNFDDWLEAVIKENEKKITKELPAAATSQLGNTSIGNLDNEKCAICVDGPKNIVFFPCGHLATCLSCAQKLKICCACRRPIQGFTKVFVV